MEPISFLPAPGAPTDSEEQDLAEIDAAIELIRQGMAARVRLVGLRTPETVAGRRPRPCPGERRPVQRRPRSRWRRRADHRAPTLGRRGPINAAAGGACRACRDQRSPPCRPSRPGRAANVAVFRYTGPGTVTARPAANAPTQPIGRMAARGRRILFGRPLASDEEAEERLSIPKALAVFSSDNLSSVAYATEAIMFTLRRGRDRCVLADHPDLDRDRHDPRHHRHLLSTDDPRLPQRRRQLHRGAREPRAAGRARRGRGPARRLRPDRVGQRRGRRGGDHLGVPGPVARHPRPGRDASASSPSCWSTCAASARAERSSRSRPMSSSCRCSALIAIGIGSDDGRRHPAGRGCRGRVGARRIAEPAPADARVRRRLQRDHRRRGRLERRARLHQTRGAPRAHDARGHGRPRRADVPGDVLAGRRDGRRPERPGDGHLADRPGGVRHRRSPTTSCSSRRWAS